MTLTPMETRSACRPQSVKGLVQTNYNRKVPAATSRHPPSAVPRSHQNVVLNSSDIGRSASATQQRLGHRLRDQSPCTICHAASGAVAGPQAAHDNTTATAVGEQLIRNWLGINSDAKLDTRKVSSSSSSSSSRLTEPYALIWV